MVKKTQLRKKRAAPLPKLPWYQMMRPWMWWTASIVLAILIALLVRLPFFGQVPTGLNRDEAALGYNAYSLRKTGADEYGHRWPISITSFGDQKLPGYVYLLIPFIAAFHFTIWSIRLPSFLSGLALVFELGYLGRQVAQRFGWSPKVVW